MTTGKVRGHTRAKPGGGTTRVRAHTRGLVTPRHSWRLARRAFRAGRQRRKVAACVLGGLALAELGAWLTVSGLALILATAAVLCGTGAVLAAQAGGARPPARGIGRPSRGGRRPAQRGTPADEHGTSPEFRRQFLGGD